MVKIQSFLNQVSNELMKVHFAMPYSTINSLFRLHCYLMLFSLVACSRVSTSVQPPTSHLHRRPSPEQVQVTRLKDPSQKKSLGKIKVFGRSSLSQLLEEFKHQAALLGGSLAKVDKFYTKFHDSPFQTTQSFPCSRNGSCIQLVERPEEIWVLYIEGRAF